MKKLFFILVLLGLTIASAQKKEELLVIKKEKIELISKLQIEVDSIQKEIDILAGWSFKAFGTVGGSVSGHNNWFSKKTPNSSIGDFGININAFANYKEHKSFWKNKANINISWYKYNDRENSDDNGDFTMGTDIFTISSLYGRKFGKKYAISALAEYRSSVFLDYDTASDPINNFNNPGYLDIGVGVTWSPIMHFNMVIHPLNYNYIFHKSGKKYESSPGSKIIVDYTKKIGNLNLVSNLSIFLSYKSFDYSNYLWTNTVSYSIWKKLGLALDLGLRKNKQEAYNYQLDTNLDMELADADNKLQFYWLFGLHFKLD